ncbi:hypothetical protein O9G_004237 [Rozella allomycis CSF55]|uniref:Uncharacterized protein n=1 Tax=Rozella allomycis (strain CSF55) TaxID=988480 RepID=A0A075B4D7_ROZAC|nr:hypothetical protein O9G_004237 [Rozella allomycis CSF55]|eukprot:EPZ36255.1 hypothetical protein O9G_004237 [Rozella allomycis CSF55]
MDWSNSNNTSRSSTPSSERLSSSSKMIPLKSSRDFTRISNEPKASIHFTHNLSRIEKEVYFLKTEFQKIIERELIFCKVQAIKIQKLIRGYLIRKKYSDDLLVCKLNRVVYISENDLVKVVDVIIRNAYSNDSKNDEVHKWKQDEVSYYKERYDMGHKFAVQLQSYCRRFLLNHCDKIRIRRLEMENKLMKGLLKDINKQIDGLKRALIACQKVQSSREGRLLKDINKQIEGLKRALIACQKVHSSREGSFILNERLLETSIDLNYENVGDINEMLELMNIAEENTDSSAHEIPSKTENLQDLTEEEIPMTHIDDSDTNTRGKRRNSVNSAATKIQKFMKKHFNSKTKQFVEHEDSQSDHNHQILDNVNNKDAE